MAAKDWNPNPVLDYDGHYPRRELQSARTVLIKCLKNPSSEALTRVMPKCGISTKYGRANIPPPLPLSPSDVRPSHTVSTSRSLPPIETPRNNPNDELSSLSISSNSSRVSDSANSSPREIIELDDSRSTEYSPVYPSNMNDSNNKEQEKLSQPQSKEKNPPKRKLSEEFDDCDASKKNKPDSTEKSSVTISVMGNMRKTSVHLTNSNLHDTSRETNTGKEMSSAAGTVSEDKPYEKRGQIQTKSDFLSNSGTKSLEPVGNDTTSVCKKIESIRTFKIWTSDDVHGNDTPLNVYKCDTCNFASKRTRALRKHLEKENHYSASLYSAVVKESQILLMYVSKMMSVTNDLAAFSTQVIVCPDCKDVFKDVFMCGYHHKQEHGSLHGKFTVCPVIAEESYQRDTCTACQQTFPSIAALLSHWSHMPDHDPIRKHKQDNTVTLFFCGYGKCKKLMYNNSGLALSHALCHYKNKRKNRKNGNAAEYSFKARQILIPEDSYELPPFSSKGQNALCKERDVLTRLRGFYTHVLPSQTKKRRVDEDIQKVSLKLACTVEVEEQKQQGVTNGKTSESVRPNTKPQEQEYLDTAQA